MQNYVVYKTQTGEITNIGIANPEDENQRVVPIGSTMLYTDKRYNSDYYVLDSELEERTALSATWDVTEIVANGVEEATLSGLPEPCIVYVDNNPVDVDDGVFEFSSNDVGVYIIYVDEASYLRESWEITCD